LRRAKRGIENDIIAFITSVGSMSDVECDRLFVYGTLVDIDFFTHMFKSKPSSVVEGQINADIYNCGTFPMILENPEGKVYGLTLTVDDLQDLLPAIDRYERFLPDDVEGSLFLRKKIDVVVDNDNVVDAWVYVGNPASLFCRERCIKKNLIDNGRWR
jgi:gamma-glutamylcyclotransferase (GGCT)/AIG2-like uncharacterized protein YtfP